MSLPFALPAWLPWWASLVLAVVLLLWGCAFLLVPFSVIGLKGRLEGIEARLDELQTEIRTLSLRLPEAMPGGPYEESFVPPPPRPMHRAPPIPPGVAPLASPPRRPPEGAPPRVPRRVEPRFDPPR
jgi:hypothetical protein